MEKNREIFKNRGLYIFVGIIIMMCLGTIYSWSVFRTAIETELNIGSFLSGLPYMTSLAFYSLSMMIAGRFLDKHSPKNIVTVGAILVSVGWILASISNNIVVFTITYGILSGIGAGIIYGVPMTVAAKWFPERKGLFVGLVLVGFGVSPLIMAPLARYLIHNYGVMNVFLILGIIFGIVITCMARFLKYPSELESRVLETLTSVKHLKNENQFDLKSMIFSKNFKWLYLNFLIATTIGLMLIGITNTIGVNFLKIDSKIVAIFISIFALFNGLGRPTFGFITDKLGSKKAMTISYVLILIAACLMLFANKGSYFNFIVAFSIFWFNLGGWLSIAPTSTMAMYGTKNYSKNYGVVFTAYGIGAIVGVIASGMILDLFNNYHNIFYLVIALCFVGLIVSITCIKERTDTVI